MIKAVIIKVLTDAEYCERCYYSGVCIGGLVNLEAEFGDCFACLQNVPREKLENFQREKTPVYINDNGKIVLGEKNE